MAPPNIKAGRDTRILHVGQPLESGTVRTPPNNQISINARLSIPQISRTAQNNRIVFYKTPYFGTATQ